MGDLPDDKVDILVYVALSEEFGALRAELGNGFQAVEFSDVALTAFVGKISSSVSRRDFKVAIVAAGKMGNTRAASIATDSINKFKPRDVVVLGIAGSVSDDMQPGDVFIPDSVTEYLANSAAVGHEGRWSFKTSGNAFPSSPRLLNRFQNFAHTQQRHFDSWQDAARRRRAEQISQRTEDDLSKAGLNIRQACKLFAGDDRKLASGPAVGKGESFLEWLGEVDRKVAAMEMESAGVYDAAFIRTPTPRIVAIRGISDYADDRKKTIEDIAGTSFRELCTRNVISLFVHAVEAGLFEREASLTVESVSAAKKAVLSARVQAIFVIGGQTNETDDVDAEKPRLHDASLRLGALLAASGAQLVTCSAFPDSVDYYTTMGYANARVGGVIQFCSPKYQRVSDAYQRLVKRFNRPNLRFQKWNSPGPETDEPESWSQAWLLAQLQALERADAVIALGGRASGSANTLLHLAEAKRLPIVPFAFLGGAAGRAYKRRDWDRLHPGLDHTKLLSEDGIEHSIEIANHLLIDRFKRSVQMTTKPKVVFISRAKQDGAMAADLKRFLEVRSMEVLLGEEVLTDHRLILVSIEQAQLRSDVCVILWSQHYARSPWCFDELMLAIEQQEYGNTRLWLFNLDDTAIVPKKARHLPAISAKTSAALCAAAEELLA